MHFGEAGARAGRLKAQTREEESQGPKATVEWSSHGPTTES